MPHSKLCTSHVTKAKRRERARRPTLKAEKKPKDGHLVLFSAIVSIAQIVTLGFFLIGQH